MAMGETVKMEREGEAAVLTLSRPEAFNALSFQMAEELATAAVALARDETVKAVVITGAGKAFCAGGDLRWVSEHPGGHAAAFHQLAGRFHAAVIEVRRMGKPVIAAVNGVAAGAGFSLALACDFRVLARSARLLQAYTSAGLCIDGGGTFALPRLIGLARALEVAAFDAPISSEQALAWGLATKVVDDGAALPEALALARELCGRSINSFACTKRLLLESFTTSLETQLEREREGIAACGEHPHGREGIAAFLQKRKPVFK
jgi:2-(1,2-epoxy-1,2-dihydrophenyl)acetyl-CoA isomerase